MDDLSLEWALIEGILGPSEGYIRMDEDWQVKSFSTIKVSWCPKMQWGILNKRIEEAPDDWKDHHSFARLLRKLRRLSK